MPRGSCCSTSRRGQPPISGAKHGPARLRSYYAAHENHMDQMRTDGFIGEDTLVLEPIGAGLLTMVGEIACLGGIVVEVEKYLEVLEGEALDAYVRTFEYKYNAFVRGHNNILRYDNSHAYAGHGDPHHKHVYDWKTGEPLPDFPAWVGERDWPTLGEVMEELRMWYWENREDLPEPDGYPELEQRG